MNISEIVSKIYSADDFDYTDMIADENKKICCLCQKAFVPIGRNSSRQRYCKRTHFLNCSICGKPIPQVPPSDKLNGIKQTCSAECTNKAKMQGMQNAVKVKYGCNNISQASEFREKINSSIKAKSAESAKKATVTMQEKYGGTGTASPIIREKIEATMQERYGISNPNESAEFREKISKRLRSSESVEKRIASSREKYGAEYPAQSQVVQSAMQETCMERYGVPYAGMIPGTREKAAETCKERYGVECVLQRSDVIAKARESMIDNQSGRISKLNLAFQEELVRAGIDFEPEFYLNGKWYDFVIPSMKTVIEIDPSYTHSEMMTHWGSNVDSRYHLMKTEIAAAAGYRCIHIFDWDIWNQIIELIKPKKRIFARNCQVTEVSPKTVVDFINMNHIQQDARGAKAAYVLEYDGKIVSTMTFSEPRYNKNYQWELLRLCTASEYAIIGGPSRMFKQFVKDHDPDSVISYCDRAKFSGDVYTNIGMKLHHTTSPSKIWSKDSKKITDNLLRQRGYDQLFNANYGKGTSNEQLMLEHGWLPVYDCGQSVYVYER